MKLRAVVLLALLVGAACTGRDEWLNVPLPERSVVVPPAPVEPTAPRVRLTTDVGDIVIAMYPAQAPLTVANFLRYVDDGFYDGTIFHRVEPENPGPPVIQGGGFDAELEPRTPREPVPSEAANGLSNVRGAVALARANDPDSGTSQFFISFVDAPLLDHRPPSAGYAVFGVVVEGMEVVDRISLVPAQPVPGTNLSRVPMVDVVVRRAVRDR
ncbi:MAG: peptidyl-prolyl cis-trans isomerase [Acidobacteria bacterium]|nr:peptidyl-prolyl cis-trans isomerase [Acidobacteriota bacterium]